MGNMVADAMRGKYPGVDAALTNSGGLRQDLRTRPPSAGEAPGEITWGEVFAVLPFGNRTVIETVTGDVLTAALLNGLSPVCNPAIATGRFPQVSGLLIDLHLLGHDPGDHQALTPRPTGYADPADRLDPHRHQRLHVLGGGDGYTALAAGTDVLQPGDDLMNVVIEYIAAHSRWLRSIDGRIVASLITASPRRGRPGAGGMDSRVPAVTVESRRVLGHHDGRGRANLEQHHAVVLGRTEERGRVVREEA